MAHSILPASIISAVLVALNAVPVNVVKAVPNTALTQAFIRTEGWTGGDAAYSAPLTKRLSIWLFGDTFIGAIKDGARTKMEMVHNTAAQLSFAPSGNLSFRYFYKVKDGKPTALLEPEDKKAYYWPSGMAFLKCDCLAIFCKVVVDKPGDDSGFGFDWIGQELVLLHDAMEWPNEWKYQRVALPGGEADILPGSACLLDGDYAYVYGTLKNATSHPAVLMRIPQDALACAKVSQFEYWTDAGWSKVPLHPATLFDSAPEMSVSRIDGLPGFWAVYSENGLSPRIMLRHSDRPEGPWSAASIIYECPEAIRNPKLACYGAKHHPELARDPRTLVITYCLNPGPLSAHRTQPFDYFPKAVTVTLTPKPVD